MTVISGDMTNISLRSQEPEQNMTKQRRTVNPQHRFILSNVQESTPCLACQWLSLSLSVVPFVSQKSDPPTNTTRCFRVFYISVHSVYFHTHIHYCLQPSIPWYGWKNWGNFRNIFNKLAEGLIQRCDTAALDSNLGFFNSEFNHFYVTRWNTSHLDFWPHFSTTCQIVIFHDISYSNWFYSHLSTCGGTLYIIC